jgi:trigger factor
MKTKIKKLPKSQIEILFEVSAEEFQKFIEKAIFELGKDLEIEGFRKGQAPKEILIPKIGKEKILALATQQAVKENYFREIFAQKFEVISQPDIQILSEPFFDKGLTFKTAFTILPEIKLPDYKKIASEIKRKEIFVEEKEIEDALLYLQKSRAKFIFENRPAKKGDFVEIEFQSPQVEQGLKRKDNFILGEGHFVSGFEENLEGMAPGQEKDFSLKFPENYPVKGRGPNGTLRPQKDLSGNLVNFKVKMNSVQRIELPEINDEFAKNLGKFENLISLKENIKEGIKIEKENVESQKIREEILEKITRETKMEIPEVLFEAEKKRMLEDLKNFVSERLKISFEDYLAKIQKTEKELLDSFSNEAEKTVKSVLILREISEREKIEVSEEEIKVAINEFLKNYPVEKTKELDLDQLKSYYEEVIRNEKTLQMLEGFATH